MFFCSVPLAAPFKTTLSFPSVHSLSSGLYLSHPLRLFCLASSLCVFFSFYYYFFLILIWQLSILSLVHKKTAVPNLCTHELLPALATAGSSAGTECSSLSGAKQLSLPPVIPLLCCLPPQQALRFPKGSHVPVLPSFTTINATHETHAGATDS